METKSITVRPELLPPEPRSPQSDASQLERLVQQKVAEVLANREDFSLRPFFDTKRVSDELRRLQTMPERRKWAGYFARHGCLICETKRVPHNSCGMCFNCCLRTAARLRWVIAQGSSSRGEQEFVTDLETLARKALQGRPGPRPKRLSPKRRPRLPL